MQNKNEAIPLLGYFIVTLSARATIHKCRQERSLEGKCFLDLCANEASRDRFESAYNRCFAFHEDQPSTSVMVRLPDIGEIELVVALEWIGNERVICYVTRHFEIEKLTEKERTVLRLSADPNLSTGTIAEICGVSEANVRATVTRINKKLNIHRREGLVMAAMQLGMR